MLSYFPDSKINHSRGRLRAEAAKWKKSIGSVKKKEGVL